MKTYFLLLTMAFATAFLSSCKSTSHHRDFVGSDPAPARSSKPLAHRITKNRQTAFRFVTPENANEVIDESVNWRVIHAAAWRYPDRRLIDALITNGADLSAVADRFGTPAKVALMWGHRDLARYLTQHSGEDFDSLYAKHRIHVEKANEQLKQTQAAMAEAFVHMIAGSNSSGTSNHSDNYMGHHEPGTYLQQAEQSMGIQ